MGELASISGLRENKSQPTRLRLLGGLAGVIALTVISLLEKIMTETPPKVDESAEVIKDLEQRTRRLENIVWIVGGLAIALGAGGAGLWGQLNNMKETAALLGSEVSSLQKRAADLETLTKELEERAKTAMASAEEPAKARFQKFVDSQRAGLVGGLEKRLATLENTSLKRARLVCNVREGGNEKRCDPHKGVVTGYSTELRQGWCCYVEETTGPRSGQ